MLKTSIAAACGLVLTMSLSGCTTAGQNAAGGAAMGGIFGAIAAMARTAFSVAKTSHSSMPLSYRPRGGRTMPRMPRWEVEVSTGWAMRAAGR